MEKYKTIKVVGVIPKLNEKGEIIFKEKQVMTKEYALSLQHSNKSQLKSKSNFIKQRAGIRKSKEIKRVKEFVIEHPNEPIPAKLPTRFGGYRY